MRRAVVNSRLVLATTLAAIFLAGCADDSKPLNTANPEGPKAQLIHDLMYPLVWVIMGIVFVLVVFGTIAIVLKNRVKGDDLDPNDLPKQTHGNTKLEWAWTIAPAILLGALTIPLIGSIWDLEERNGDPELEVGEVGPTPADTGVDVMVIGQQWWWEYRYDVDADGFFVDANGDGKVDDLDKKLPLELALDPDDVVTATELVVPAGEQVDLLISSRDVIHSFWIPRLNGKRDAVPGRWHTWSVEANEPGKYTGWCTEFCGLSHARMRMSTVALPKQDFEAWLANQATPAVAPSEDDEEVYAGRMIFQNNCMSCHVINEVSEDPDVPALEYSDDFVADLDAEAAPNLTHFASRSTYAGGIYSVYAGPLGEANDDELDVADYLKLSELAKAPETADDYQFNKASLKRWVKNAPEQKDMDPDSKQGMLAFPQLSDEELEQVVAYLATLD